MGKKAYAAGRGGEEKRLLLGKVKLSDKHSSGQSWRWSDGGRPLRGGRRGAKPKKTEVFWAQKISDFFVRRQPPWTTDRSHTNSYHPQLDFALLSRQREWHTHGISLAKDKRAISVWISWVLIVGLAVVLATFFFSWARGFTSDSVSDLTERSDLVRLCEQAAINIDSACQNTQTLNINVSNNKNLEVDELLFRMFDIYGQPQSWETNVSLEPQDSVAVKVVKQGIIDEAHIIPVLRKDDRRILCEGRKVTLQDLTFC